MTSNGLRVVAKKAFLQQKNHLESYLKSQWLMRIFNCVKMSASADVHALESLSPLERYGGSIDTLLQWTAVTTVTSSLCGDWTAWIEHLGDITWHLLTSDKYTRILAATDSSNSTWTQQVKDPLMFHWTLLETCTLTYTYIIQGVVPETESTTCTLTVQCVYSQMSYS